MQNIILACRALGLATLITTNHIRCEDEVQAVLGLPPDVSTYALMPIGYPYGKFGPLARRPLEEVTYADYAELNEPDQQNIKELWADFINAIESNKRPISDVEEIPIADDNTATIEENILL